jgi:UDP-N-acetylglucosamine--dolichyl-phosphate N-acetylglucosaminephosphotransferase
MVLARPLSPVLLFALVPVASWFVIRPLLDPAPSLPGLYASFGFSIFALLVTLYLVPALGPSFVRANLKGKDLLKVYDDPMCVVLVYRFILSREFMAFQT